MANRNYEKELRNTRQAIAKANKKDNALSWILLVAAIIIALLIGWRTNLYKNFIQQNSADEIVLGDTTSRDRSVDALVIEAENEYKVLSSENAATADAKFLEIAEKISKLDSESAPAAQAYVASMHGVSQNMLNTKIDASYETEIANWQDVVKDNKAIYESYLD